MCAATDVVVFIAFGDDDAHELSTYNTDACDHFPTSWWGAGGCQYGFRV
jgi:hypothetical protein